MVIGDELMENVLAKNQPRANVPPTVVNKNVPPQQDQAPKSPLPAVPKAPPEQGGVARPPINNISNQANQAQNAAAMPVGKVQPEAAAAAASQLASKEQSDKKAVEEKKDKSMPSKASSTAEENKSVLNTSEEDLITDMRDTIGKKAMQVTKKVNRSAFKYIYDNTSWLNKDDAVEAEKFFTIKIPKVLANELSKILNSALGLEDDPENV